MLTPVRARFLPVVVMVGLVLTACAPTQAQPSGGSQVAQPSSNLTGGTVKIGMAGYPDSLNPGNGLLTEAYTMYELVYDTPIAVTADGSYVPEVATDWSVADDGVTWTMTLRDDVVFHDGTPMTSEDVKFTLELYRDTEDFPYLPSYPDVFSKIEAPDPTHVVLTADSPIGNFEYRMAFMYILPKHIWEKVKDPVKFENDEMIGTGPFKLVKATQDESVELASNQDYWKGAPFVDGLAFQTIDNGDTRIAALDNGDVDMIINTPTTAVPALRNNPDLALVLADPLIADLRDLIINQIKPEDCPTNKGGKCTGHPALKDVNVRKALATAIDKNQLITVGKSGLATPGLTLVPPGLGDFYASEIPDYQFSVDAANKILDDAGYADTDGDGIRECLPSQDCKTGDLTFRFTYPDNIDSAPAEADALKGMWNAIGVDIQIQGLEEDTVTSICCPAFDYDIILWGWGSDPDPAFLLGVALCQEIPTGFSETGYCNKQYDDLYKAQGIEPDHTKRVEIVHQMQQILMDDVVYIIPYYAQLVEAHRVDTFTGWDDALAPLGLEDPGQLSILRPTSQQ
ncbi:MAG TPA: ABC transporter substrate-binding protein [Candidatus Limnocylindria bacterium]|jgi:peptide/nickel transport system substrate-binding protein|nr:ABC transporter substrate-binding protein [Candidatus Limnocylindria bacterium]